MSARVVDALEDALIRAGLGHLEVFVEEDATVSVRPRDPAWREYRVLGMPDAPEMLERLETLDAELQPRIRAGAGGFTVGSAHLGERRFQVDQLPALVEHLLQDHLLPYLARPVLALEVCETEDGHALAVVTLARD